MMKVDSFSGSHPAILPARGVAAVAADLRGRKPDYYDTWVMKAQPGAREIYGMGIDAPSAGGPGTAHRLRKLSEAGLVRLHLVRARPHDSAYPIDFVVVRRAKPVPKGFPAITVERMQVMNSASKVGGQ